ncbi:17033_t:CDS:1, partial [Funneliformis geosporum]
DTLLKVCGILEQKKRNERLSFAQKKNVLAKILSDDENLKILNDIIDDNNILYLVKNSKPDWKFLNELRKLDSGRTINFDGIKIAHKRAFKMKGCNVTKIGAEGYRKGKIEFNSNEDYIM